MHTKLLVLLVVLHTKLILSRKLAENWPTLSGRRPTSIHAYRHKQQHTQNENRIEQENGKPYRVALNTHQQNCKIVLTSVPQNSAAPQKSVRPSKDSSWASCRPPATLTPPPAKIARARLDSSALDSLPLRHRFRAACAGAGAQECPKGHAQ